MDETTPAIADLPALETPRLLLRQRDLRDFNDLMLLNGDPEVMRYLHAVEPETERRIKLETRIRQRFPGGLGYWTVLAKAAPTVFLGYAGVIPINRTGPGVEFSYRFHRAAQGHGYAREAVERLILYVFEVLGHDCIEIHTHPANARSLKLADRLGFAESGTVLVDEGVWTRLVKAKPPHRRGRA